ncbi:hypothetical protein GW17_00013977 [Ensete ventricosum]|nr:hypothetical protein GW17_00013977 [Ensete ventricosum]
MINEKRKQWKKKRKRKRWRKRRGVRRNKEEEAVEEVAYLKRGWGCAVVDHNGFPMSRWRRGLVNSQWAVECLAAPHLIAILD